MVTPRRFGHLIGRRTLLASLAAASLPVSASRFADDSLLLSITGDIGKANTEGDCAYDFSEGEFMRLPGCTILTSTAWTARAAFCGPRLIDVMHAAGVNAGTLTCRSLDDYAVQIPWADLVRYGVILAHSQDGQRLDRRRWGPLWTIYPRDDHPAALTLPIAESRFIWQVDRIEVNV